MLIELRTSPSRRFLDSSLLSSALRTCTTRLQNRESSKLRIRVQSGNSDASEGVPKLSKRQAKKRRQLLLRMQIYPATGDTVSLFMREKYEKEARRYWDLFYKRNEGRFFKDRHYLHKEWGHLLGTTTTSDVGSDVSGGVNGGASEAALMDGGASESGALLTAAEENKSKQENAHSGKGGDSRKERVSEFGKKSLPGDKRVVLEVGCGAGNTVYPLLQENPAAFIHACDFSPRAVELVKVSLQGSKPDIRVPNPKNVDQVWAHFLVQTVEY